MSRCISSCSVRKSRHACAESTRYRKRSRSRRERSACGRARKGAKKPGCLACGCEKTRNIGHPARTVAFVVGENTNERNKEREQEPGDDGGGSGEQASVLRTLSSKTPTTCTTRAIASLAASAGTNAHPPRHRRQCSSLTSVSDRTSYCRVKLLPPLQYSHLPPTSYLLLSA